MTQQSCRPRRVVVRTPQIQIAFPTKCILDPKERAEVVALLSRLLLQVASADSDKEAADDAS